MISYFYKGKELLHNRKGPKPNFWRAVTDNDLGNKMHTKNIKWKAASMHVRVQQVITKRNRDGSVNMFVVYELPDVETTFATDYTIYGNGVIKIVNTLNTTDYQADIPRIGMRFQIPVQHKNLTWFGRGPWENYNDRNTAAFVGLYQSDVAGQYVCRTFVRRKTATKRGFVGWH